MSRKDYELIAKALNGTRPGILNGDTYAQWLYDVQTLATALANENARFNRAKFVYACDKD